MPTRLTKARIRRLAPREQAAVEWVRRSYPRNWRRQFRETFAEHMLKMPAYMQLAGHYPALSRMRKWLLWADWYDHPFGLSTWNRHVRTLRHLYTGYTSPMYLLTEGGQPK